jgi:hypothetical protein
VEVCWSAVSVPEAVVERGERLLEQKQWPPPSPGRPGLRIFVRLRIWPGGPSISSTHSGLGRKKSRVLKGKR